mgnify:CR=1 FL=1
MDGVSVGSTSVIAAGSTVNRSIPDNVLTAEHPCRVIRALCSADDEKYRKGFQAYIENIDEEIIGEYENK